MIISDCIPTGRENAVTRSHISKVTGIGDRELRRCVKELNKTLVESEGSAIISSSHSSGFWKTCDLAELEAYEAEQRHRAAMILENLKPIRSLIERIKEADQMKL